MSTDEEPASGPAADAPPPRTGGRTSAAGSALEKSMRVLEAVAAPGGPHRLADLTTAAAVPKSSTFRILASLVEQDFVRVDGDSRYTAGPRLRALAARVGAAEPASIERILADLHRATGQTVHLALRTGETLTYIRKVEGDQPIRTASRIGMRMPLHSTAIGKSLLAHLPDEEVDAIVAATGLPARTPRTLTTRHALDAQRALARVEGYALDDEENEATIRCIGTAVLDPAGRPLGGVSVTTVTFLVPLEEITSYAPALRAAGLALAPLL
ncbi:IclR family transcriptional regulator [Streptomyces sp. NPDC048606]|uniref:IclR family transcriptional regulator n=1 Tax=Streptomyces sp. NPDC048606 TaxID=3154726 RepID=UPI00342414A4